MFVRTKKGKIFDCVVHEQMGKLIYYPKTSKTNGYIDWNEVYKKSENIIDILEVGDYVNGYKIYSGGKKHFDYILTWDDIENYYMKIPLLNVDIKSIVTHEQMESMSYKVEG